MSIWRPSSSAISVTVRSFACFMLLAYHLCKLIHLFSRCFFQVFSISLGCAISVVSAVSHRQLCFNPFKPSLKVSAYRHQNRLFRFRKSSQWIGRLSEGELDDLQLLFDEYGQPCGWLNPVTVNGKGNNHLPSRVASSLCRRVLFRAQKVRGSQGRGIVHLHCDSECTIFCHASGR